MNETIRSEDLFMAYVPTVRSIAILEFCTMQCVSKLANGIYHRTNLVSFFSLQVVRDIIYANARQKMGDFVQQRYPQLASSPEVLMDNE